MVGYVWPKVGYVWLGGRICPVNRNFEQWKSRSEAKMMRLDPGKLTISKLDNI
jgi:hypothetical protein